MEGLAVNPAFWRGKRVFLTGHTGFKGGWLSLWLQSLGAEVHGYALPPPTEPSFFVEAGVEAGLASQILDDIGDLPCLREALHKADPEIILHLAAQPLVRYSYREPLETFATNVMGTAHLLEAARSLPGLCAIVNVTTDKCYENREWLWGYRENEALGGHDPYSASKACSELVTAAFRASFYASSKVALASARAGNVIGGGDWALDRLVPDFFRAFDRDEEVVIRSPRAIRPWQHVLEPLSGYLMLAERLYTSGQDYAGAWNFGPAEEDAQPVAWVVERLAAAFDNAKWRCEAKADDPHEAHYLRLDSSKARQLLAWAPRWRLHQALQKTAEWHLAWRSGQDMAAFSRRQIAEYTQAQEVVRVAL